LGLIFNTWIGKRKKKEERITGSVLVYFKKAQRQGRAVLNQKSQGHAKIQTQPSRIKSHCSATHATTTALDVTYLSIILSKNIGDVFYKLYISLNL
jgi:hypothetical protein